VAWRWRCGAGAGAGVDVCAGAGTGAGAGAGAGVLIPFHDSDMEAIRERWNQRVRSVEMAVG